MKAVCVQPDEDGLAPVLKAGEYCHDRMHGVWHFCTPDATRFAIDPQSSSCKLVVKRGSWGISIVHGVVDLAGSRAGVVQNIWTIQAGKWTQDV